MLWASVRILLVLIISKFCLLHPQLNFAAEDEPAISISGSEHALRLGKQQQDAIRAYNPEFQIRRQMDYLPSLVKGYSYSDHQLPYAVIGDFNGDGRKDVVLQGHDKTGELLIAVLSSKNVYRVKEIQRSQLIDPKTEYYGMGHYTEYGLWIYLTFVPKGTISSLYESHPLHLSADAFNVNYYEKASTLYYLNGDKFQKYITSD
jgi:hypothetical protein